MQRNRKIIAVYPYILLVKLPANKMSGVEVIAEQPIAFEAMLEAINGLSAEQLAKLALTGNARLHKLINSGSVKAKKSKAVAEVKVRKSSAGLDYNRAWVVYVLDLATKNGWPSFEKTVGKKGQPSYKQVMSASVQDDSGAFIFADTGKAFVNSDAMSLAKCLKDGNDAVWQSYVKVNPQPVSQPKVKAPKVVPVLTPEEITAQAEAKAAAAEAKKEAAKVKRQEAAAAKKAEKEAAKAAKPAAPRKTPKTVTPAPVAPAAPAPVVAALKKMPKKAAEPAWVCPPEGAGVWTYKGVEYIRDDEDRVWTKAVDEDGEPAYGEWVGLYNKTTGEFDKTMADPRDE